MSQSYTNKTCPKCGAGFKCYNMGIESCWCEAYYVAPEKLEEMRNQWDGCLCEDCLTEFVQV